MLEVENYRKAVGRISSRIALGNLCVRSSFGRLAEICFAQAGMIGLLFFLQVVVPLEALVGTMGTVT
jgi:hypothetical protein